MIEHPEGIILVDTGESAKAASPNYFPSWHPYMKNAIFQVQAEQEVGTQQQRIGIHPNDVRWVILTHLHTDHAGGLHHFPKSDILVVRRAFELASGFAGQVRGFLPQHWPSWSAPRLIELAPNPFGVFPNSFRLTNTGNVIIDGLALNGQEAKITLGRIQQFAHSTPCIYLPAHDPESGNRLVTKKVVH